MYLDTGHPQIFQTFFIAEAHIFHALTTVSVASTLPTPLDGMLVHCRLPTAFYKFLLQDGKLVSEEFRVTAQFRVQGPQNLPFLIHRQVTRTNIYIKHTISPQQTINCIKRPKLLLCTRRKRDKRRS